MSAILVVGSVAYDGVETPFGKAQRVLGGSASFFSVAASFFAPVRLVAVVGTDFAEKDVAALAGRGVDLEGLQRAEGRTFYWEGRYSFDLNSRETLRTDLNVFESFRPRLPESYRDSTHVFLGNIHPGLQLEVLEQVRGPRLVACDTMNFWISGDPEGLRKTLERVDILLINDAEARQLSGEWNMVKAARAIRAMGPRTLVVKKGEHGVLMFGEGGSFAAPAYPLEEVFDPTGAGDAFAGGFVGYLAAHHAREAEVSIPATDPPSREASTRATDPPPREMSSRATDSLRREGEGSGGRDVPAAATAARATDSLRREGGGPGGRDAAPPSFYDDETLRRAVVMGSTLASFCVEAFSLERLLRLTRAEIDERFRLFKRLTQFEVL